MAISLFDASAACFGQTLGAISAFLERGQTHCTENKIDLAELVETRLHPDMLPFRFQVLSTVHHSIGALEGVKRGLFQPPGKSQALDYAGLQKVVADAVKGLEPWTPAEVNALEGREVIFEIGDRKMPFTAEGFLLSFSLPNFYFHATTTYDILRMKGVPLGKRNFLGRMRMKA